MNKIITDREKIKTLFSHNVEEVIIQDNLEKKLLSGKQLRIKLGCDPSRPDLHLGHSVVIRKLKEFQDLGHQVVFIIGDSTGMIGDPSGKSKTRPALSAEKVKENAKSYFEQVGKILDIKKTEIRYNSEWFSKLRFEDVLTLTGKFTVARILERDDFSKRLKNGIDIGVNEIMYPIMQAYDSIMIEADVEIGGTDQKFNMLAGRGLQKKMDKSQQNVITCPLLVGLNGKEKMSKSLDNYIGITESPNSMFGKIMSISDDMIFYYFKLLTDISKEELDAIEKDLRDISNNPRDLKVKLSKNIIAIYHNKTEADKAEEEFNKIFRDKNKPTNVPEIKLAKKEYNLLDLLTETKLASSKSDARRLVQQGGVKINDVVQKDFETEIEIKDGMIVQVGKRRFVKIKK
ncbi:tyrosine--tRNA ligase [Candidatus Parcubacteria bacterium]|nr:tyrosine--tRNA ligase [Candidatus Parcubacteria bacterium]